MTDAVGRRRPSRLVLLGHPVHHSLSPRFQNAALRAAGIEVAYEALDVAPGRLAHHLAALRTDGAAGNITIPHKERAAAICDVLTSDARRAGAVNTFWVEGERLVGDNTDVGGFAVAVASLLGGEPVDQRIALLGAGGAAAAVLCAVERWRGCAVVLHNRTRARAEALRARFPVLSRIADSPADAVAESSLIVNATSIGLRDDGLPVSPADLPDGAAALDLVYRRGETPFVRAARARGLRASDGLPMLLEQGALAFERWFGFEPDRAAMSAALR